MQLYLIKDFSGLSFCFDARSKFNWDQNKAVALTLALLISLLLPPASSSFSSLSFCLLLSFPSPLLPVLLVLFLLLPLFFLLLLLSSAQTLKVSIDEVFPYVTIFCSLLEVVTFLSQGVLYISRLAFHTAFIVCYGHGKVDSLII